MKEENSQLTSRLGLEPTPAHHLRPPSVSSQGSNSHPHPIHAATGPAITNWLQSLIPPNSAAHGDAGSEAIPSRAPSVKSDTGSHLSNKGHQNAAASPPVQQNWFQALVPQANPAEQPLAMPWGKLF